MRFDHITKGTEIITQEGKLICEDYNGSIVYLREYLYNDETEVSDIDNGERRLTLSEIGHVMREWDGNNHRVMWDEPEDDEETEE